jgi:hypothetical protein
MKCQQHREAVMEVGSLGKSLNFAVCVNAVFAAIGKNFKE